MRRPRRQAVPRNTGILSPSAPRRRRGRPPLEAGRSAPKASNGSEGEEEVAHLVNHLGIAGSRATWEPAEERQHMVCRAVEVEQRIASLEVALLRFLRPLAVLDRRAPLAAPRTFCFDSVLSVHARRR